MGKGKGTFEYWATRCAPILEAISSSNHLNSVPTGRVLFEIGGVPIREELAKEGSPLFPLALCSSYWII